MSNFPNGLDRLFQDDLDAWAERNQTDLQGLASLKFLYFFLLYYDLQLIVVAFGFPCHITRLK